MQEFPGSLGNIRDALNDGHLALSTLARLGLNNTRAKACRARAQLLLAEAHFYGGASS
jgi:hypothetical protein